MVSEHEIDPFLDEIAAELKRPVRFDSGLESRVMRAIDSSVADLPLERTRTPWLLRPRTFYVSPLAGLAVAAGLVAIITMSVLRTAPTVELANSGDRVIAPNEIPVTPVAFDPNAAPPPVRYAAPFTYIDPKAATVAVVGSFNDWDASRDVLTRSSDSLWTGNILLPPGRYEYQLVVDGKWIADPGAQRTAESDFGGTNSVLIVAPVPR